MLMIVTALPWEAERFTRRLRGRRRNEAGEGWTVWGDRGRVSVRVVVSGPGIERATDAASAVRDLDPSTTGILAVGVAAGLAEELKPGALVLAQRTLRRRINGGRAGGAITTDPKLREFCAAALERSGLRWSRGDVVTVDRAVADPTQKRRLGTEAGAAVALMEDYAWAQTAQEWGLPFASMRAVLDPVGTRVPEAVLSWDWQGAHAGEVTRGLARRPWLPLSLGRLAWERRTAVRAIDRFLEALLTSPPEPDR